MLLEAGSKRQREEENDAIFSFEMKPGRLGARRLFRNLDGKYCRVYVLTRSQLSKNGLWQNLKCCSAVQIPGATVSAPESIGVCAA